MAVRLITPPAVEPITLAQAKTHLRVDDTAEDDLISALISASRTYCEKHTGRAFITQTWELVIDQFPALPLTGIAVPMPPLQSVTSVKYDDTGGVETTLGTIEYEVDTASEPGWVVPVTTGWPTSIFDGINAVRIRFVAGYAPGTDSPIDLAANVPASLKAAMLLHIGQLYENREDVIVGTTITRMPTGGVMDLLHQYRVVLDMA